jgi:hypothetical protein
MFWASECHYGLYQKLIHACVSPCSGFNGDLETAPRQFATLGWDQTVRVPVARKGPPFRDSDSL